MNVVTHTCNGLQKPHVYHLPKMFICQDGRELRVDFNLFCSFTIFFLFTYIHWLPSLFYIFSYALK
jgi:hypothetical protein